KQKLPFVVTLDDLIGLEKDDLRDTGGRNTRLRMAEQAFKKAFAAGIPIVFGSGATSPAIPHGKQANQFAYYAKWGMTTGQAIQTAYLPAARLLNYNWDTQIGRYARSEEHTSELQSQLKLVCRILLAKKKVIQQSYHILKIT